MAVGFVESEIKTSATNRGLSRIADLQVSSVLFYTALCVWIFIRIIYASFFASSIVGLMKPVRLVCLAMLALSELVSIKVTPRYLGSFLLCAVVALIEWSVGQSFMVDAVVFILCSRNRDFKVTARVGFITILSATILVFLAARFGVITDYVVNAGGRQRHCLGFRYALYPSAFIFSSTCLLIFLRGNRIRLLEAALAGIVNYTIFDLTDSRLSFAMSLLAIFLALICRLFGKKIIKWHWLGSIICASFMLSAAVSFILPFLYNRSSGWSWATDKAVVDRLRFAYQALTQYGITLFGSDLKADMVGSGLNINGVRNAGEYFYVDNLYVRMIVEDGLIVFATYLICMTMVARQAWKSGHLTLCFILLCLALHGVVDNLMMNLHYNPFLLLISTLHVEGQRSSTIVAKGRFAKQDYVQTSTKTGYHNIRLTTR